MIDFYDEMVTYAETHLSDTVGNLGYVKLYIDDANDTLKQIAAIRGYRRLVMGTPLLEYVLDKIPELDVPGTVISL